MTIHTIEPAKICLVCEDKQMFFQFTKQKFDFYRCKSCGLLSTFPLPNEETIMAHYDQARKDGNYGLGKEYMKYYIQVYKDFVKKLERKLHSYDVKLSGLKILDIGCFTGELLELLKEKGADVYGLELQDEAVKIANEKLPGRILKADVSSNIFPQMKFDIVIMSGLIEHVVDPEKRLRRAFEILSPRGFLMLQTPNSSSFLARILGKLWPPCAPVEHIHLFSKKSLKKILTKTGFENISLESHWKKLPIVYVYNNFRNFGPEFFRLLKPFFNVLPESFRTRYLPFYIGEIIVFAQKY